MLSAQTHLALNLVAKVRSVKAERDAALRIADWHAGHLRAVAEAGQP
jgi:hypothetical protein